MDLGFYSLFSFLTISLYMIEEEYMYYGTHVGIKVGSLLPLVPGNKLRSLDM